MWGFSNTATFKLFAVARGRTCPLQVHHIRSIHAGQHHSHQSIWWVLQRCWNAQLSPNRPIDGQLWPFKSPRWMDQTLLGWISTLHGLTLSTHPKNMKTSATSITLHINKHERSLSSFLLLFFSVFATTTTTQSIKQRPQGHKKIQLQISHRQEKTRKWHQNRYYYRFYM